MSPDELGELSELIVEVGVRWYIRWGTITPQGVPLLADPRHSYRRARYIKTIVTYSVADMREEIRKVDTEYACDL